MREIYPTKVDSCAWVLLDMRRPLIPVGVTPEDARWYQFYFDPKAYGPELSHQILKAWNVCFTEGNDSVKVVLYDSWMRKTNEGYESTIMPSIVEKPAYHDSYVIRIYDLGKTPPLTLSDDDRIGEAP